MKAWTWIGLALVASGAAAFVACSGGGKSTPPPGAACVLASDCNNPLSCSFGKCHNKCEESRDCESGERCIKDGTGANICQLPEDNGCTYNSDCDRPLVCAIDRECRNQCVADVDCPRTQKCVPGVNVCADLAEINPATGMLYIPDAGVRPPEPDGGMSLDDGGLPAGDGSAPVGDAAITNPAPVSGITIDKAIARQGEVGIIITVNGSNLGNPREIKVGDLSGTLGAGATPASFTVRVTVPHGATLGVKDFSAITDGGTVNKAGILTVSAITVSTAGLDTNRGTSDLPFRTFTNAMTVADVGDTVQVLDGVYDVAGGEKWEMAAIPNQVTVLGQGANTKLIGPGSQGGTANVDGLWFKGNATVKNLQVGFFRYNVLVNKAMQKVTLDNVIADGARYSNVYLESAAKGAEFTATGDATSFKNSASQSVYIVAPESKVSLSGKGTISALTSYAVQISADKVTFTIDGLTIEGGANYASVYNYGVDGVGLIKNALLKDQIYWGRDTGELTIEGTTVEIAGTNVAVDSYASKLTITNSTFKGGYYSTHQRRGAAKVRGSKFLGYMYTGYNVYAGTLDMGTATEGGDNEFMGPSGSGNFGLDDNRAFAQDPITVSNSSFNGNVPPTKDETGPVSIAGRYSIQTTNNVIKFFMF